MPHKLFNFIIVAENLFGTYRNYVFLGKLKAVLALLRIVIESTVIVVHFGYYFLRFWQVLTPIHIYFTLDSLTSFIYIVLLFINSRKFESFLNVLHRTSQHIGDDIYIKNLAKNRIRKIISLVICLLFSAAIFISTKIVNFLIPTFAPSSYSFYIFQLSLLLGEMRHVTQYILFSWMITVIDEQLKCLNRSVMRQDAASYANAIEQNEETLIRIEISEIDNWSNVYVNIKESSRISNSICGVQLSIMITTAILFYITVVYNMITEIVKGSGLPITDAFLRFGKLVILVFLLYRLSRDAQQAQNRADTLRRLLCRKLIAPFHSESEYKAMRDLVRLVATKPIRAQAFGAVDINMTLLPVCLAAFTSYTVIVLQFNNVI